MVEPSYIDEKTMKLRSKPDTDPDYFVTAAPPSEISPNSKYLLKNKHH